MIVKSSDWKRLSDVQKKQKILNYYIKTMKRNLPQNQARIEEATFILQLLQ